MVLNTKNEEEVVMKKLMSAFMVLTLLMSMVITGCSSKEVKETKIDTTEKVATESKKKVTDKEEVQEKTHVRFMYWNKQDSLQSLIDLINKELPNVDFEFQFVDTKSYQTVYKTQMSAGEGPELLCIQNVESEVRAGYAMDLTGQAFLENYTDSVMNELAIDGESYCVPGPSWFGGYFYNKDLFEENGLNVPKTFDEFVAVCEKLTELGIKPIANPIKSPNYLMHYACSFLTPEFLRQPEGMNWDKDFKAGKVTMSETWGPYLGKWSEMATKGFIKEEELGMDFDQAMDEFVTGRAGMIDSGPWDVSIIHEKNPDMNIDMMPFVGNKGDTGWLFGGPGIRFGVNANLDEKTKKAALSVIELISTPEGQKAYWENNKGGSSYVKGVEFEMPKEFDGCKEVFAKGNIYAPFMVWNPGVFEEFGKQLQGYIAGATTLEEVMKATDEKNQEVLEKLQQ